MNFLKPHFSLFLCAGAIIIQRSADFELWDPASNADVDKALGLAWAHADTELAHAAALRTAFDNAPSGSRPKRAGRAPRAGDTLVADDPEESEEEEEEEEGKAEAVSEGGGSGDDDGSQDASESEGSEEAESDSTQSM